MDFLHMLEKLPVELVEDVGETENIDDIAEVAVVKKKRINTPKQNEAMRLGRLVRDRNTILRREEREKKLDEKIMRKAESLKRTEIRNDFMRHVEDVDTPTNEELQLMRRLMLKPRPENQPQYEKPYEKPQYENPQPQYEKTQHHNEKPQYVKPHQFVFV